MANIAPGETIDITIEYLQTARYDAGEFSLRVPLTLTPRYGAPDTPEGTAALTSTVLPAPLRSPRRAEPSTVPETTAAGDAQHPVARSVRPCGARSRHATRLDRQPQPRAESRPRARGGVEQQHGARRVARRQRRSRQPRARADATGRALRARHRRAARADGPRPRDRVATADGRGAGRVPH